MKLLFLPLKMIKNRYVLFVVGILIFTLTNLLFNISPVINPQGWYNIDSAIYYLIYYVCGFVFYPSIEIFLKQDTRLKQMAFVFIGTYSLFFAVMLYCEKTILLIPMMNNLAIIINSLIKSFVMIAFVVLLSYMLNKVNILAKLGQRSLYLCGNETIIKMIVTALISELGLSMPIERVSIYIYVVVLLIFSYFLSYFEFPLFNKIKQFNFTNK